MTRNFKGDLVASLVSFGLIGLGGLAMVIAIAENYPADALGSFNIVYSVYLIGSQLAGAGINFSVLRHIPLAKAESSEREEIVAGALLAVLVNASAWTAIFVASQPVVASAFGGEGVASGLLLVAPALIFCSANKVLLGYINAKEEYIFLAIQNSFRACLLLIFIFAFVANQIQQDLLPLLITLSEFGLFVSLIGCQSRTIRSGLRNRVFFWFREHLRFGYRSVVGTICIDFNTRIDVIILGLFYPASSVGIYSIAAMLAEGFGQLGAVLRTLANPRLAIARVSPTPLAFQTAARKARNFAYLIMLPAGLIAMAGYGASLELFSLNDRFSDAYQPLVILIGCLLVSIGYTPLMMIMNQAGRPTDQSLLYIYIFLGNLAFNFALVPALGVLGSAIATGGSYLLTAFVVKRMSLVRLGISI